MIVRNDNKGYLADSSNWDTIYVPGQKKCKTKNDSDDEDGGSGGKCLLNFSKAK
jgi:hypothetical protein